MYWAFIGGLVVVIIILFIVRQRKQG